MSVVSTRIPWLDIRTFHTHLIAIVAIVCVVSVKARAPKTAHCFLHQITHVNQRGRSVQAAHARGVQSHHPTSARLTAHGTRATRWRKPCAKSSARRRATASRKLMLRSRVYGQRAPAQRASISNPPDWASVHQAHEIDSLHMGSGFR